ncbi:FMN-dependent alpha-hydroxy acid dehydrogenase [Auricularia subglabra TFB-10046 SS5]|uniref:FMN-dependent alpha-hydroxy acid dehydrogenase n=1 Tax=Auricularia subglabra (strain TFB-10046 / SS5) TaxID=717982 RepID=J0WVF4_AURST|nr:FMN-dependent alpha-hydroxy acid dehydrogenase [Auricularia subglabra TFB-10046 SS5]
MSSTQTAEHVALLHHHHGSPATSFSTYQRDIYASFRSPIFSVDPMKWEALARRKIPDSNFYYVAGSANQGLTCAANVGAFARYRLRPRMLADATFRDTSVEIFGQKLASPLIVAPIGVQGIVHKDGEEATARACQKLDIPMILSTAATRSIEEVAAANGTGKRWYQIYWPKPEHDDITISLLQRAQASGYSVLVVTADTFALGWRPKDLDSSYLPFIYGQGCQVGFSDPVFNKKYEAAQREANKRPLWTRLRELFEVLLRPQSLWGALKILWNIKAISKSRAWLDVVNSGTYRTWDDLRVLRANWAGPIVLKGVQTVEDARLAAEHGLDGIVVSNHGGRQVDGAVASLDALAVITADERVKTSGLTVLFDSGVRTGSDVIKALALGARGVLIGRPYMYGLAIAGQRGVEHVLKCTLADFDNTLGLIGKLNVRQLGRDDLEIVASA